MKKNLRKLSLCRETLHTLDLAPGQVGGGAVVLAPGGTLPPGATGPGTCCCLPPPVEA